VTVLITGVNGFLGTHLARHWSSLGHSVYGAARHWPDPPAGLPLHCRITFDLRGEIRPENLAGVDVVVHLAYDRKAGIELNLEGVKRVFTAATVVGVPRQIFVSSYSARPDARSEYGRLKYLLETYFLERGQTIVRPGLVIGNGGLFARNMEQILHAPLMPLLNAGNDLLPVVAVEDLVTAMTTLLQREPGAYNLFNKRLIPMRQFVEAINRAGHHRAVYFNIPLSWAIAGLSCASKLRIRLPIDLDNLRALRQNQQCIHASDLDDLVPDCRSFESMIEAAVAHRTQAG
jgi:nucleoside-diphosphate-sugar epimerase